MEISISVRVSLPKVNLCHSFSSEHVIQSSKALAFGLFSNSSKIFQSAVLDVDVENVHSSLTFILVYGVVVKQILAVGTI